MNRMTLRSPQTGVSIESSQQALTVQESLGRSRPLSNSPAPWVVVPAGGQGTRLQQFIRQILGSERPKQFCPIIGSRSMLRHTWDRALQLTSPDRIVTVVTTGQEPYLADERRAGIPGTVLVQPQNKETGPGLALPLLWIAQRDPAASVVLFPADHFVWEEARFLRHVRTGLRVLAQHRDRLALLGVEADGPERSYGWIVPGDRVWSNGSTDLYSVVRFWGKPDRRTALYLYGCGHLWNTLVVAGRLTTYLRLVEETMPEVIAALRPAAADLDDGAATSLRRLEAAYARCPRANFSHALLVQRPDALLVLAARDVFWSDWGDPDRIVRTLRRLELKPDWLPVYAHSRRIAEQEG